MMRIEMYKKVTKLLGAIALTGWMGVANATLIFDFSWDSPEGEVTGVIEGLIDSPIEQEALQVTITSLDGIATDFDLIGGSQRVFTNEFIVVNKELVVAVLASSGPEFYLRMFSNTAYFEFYGGQGVVEYQSFSAPILNRVSVPEPSTVILLSLGLAGLSFVRYRKQS
ncbi:MAG: hypothetical protein ACI9LX_000320 [Paraglaciecola sp.]|jgi:hypothetical protein